jgi:hypothetical protein
MVHTSLVAAVLKPVQVDVPLQLKQRVPSVDGVESFVNGVIRGFVVILGDIVRHVLYYLHKKKSDDSDMHLHWHQ